MPTDLEDRIYMLVRARFQPCDSNCILIRNLIEEHATATPLNRGTMSQSISRVRKSYDKDDWPSVRFMFKSVLVFILSERRQDLHLVNVSQLFETYPEFISTDQREQELLLLFHNLMKVALLLFNPANKKGELISLIGRMCGTVYVTGGGQTAATDRRVLIFERLTGIGPRKRNEVRWGPKSEAGIETSLQGNEGGKRVKRTYISMLSPATNEPSNPGSLAPNKSSSSSSKLNGGSHTAVTYGEYGPGSHPLPASSTSSSSSGLLVHPFTHQIPHKAQMSTTVSASASASTIAGKVSAPNGLLTSQQHPALALNTQYRPAMSPEDPLFRYDPYTMTPHGLPGTGVSINPSISVSASTSALVAGAISACSVPVVPMHAPMHAPMLSYSVDSYATGMSRAYYDPPPAMATPLSMPGAAPMQQYSYYPQYNLQYNHHYGMYPYYPPLQQPPLPQPHLQQPLPHHEYSPPHHMHPASDLHRAMAYDYWYTQQTAPFPSTQE